MADAEWTWNRTDNDSSDWIPLDLDGLKSQRDPREIPFRLLAKRVKSSSPDSESLLHDPLRFLMDEGAKPVQDLNADRAAGEDVKGVLTKITDEWHVTTFIVNHHRTLSAVHVKMMVIVSEEEQTVALTIYKQAP